MHLPYSKLPQPGEIVTVTTRHWRYVLGEEGWENFTLENAKVLEPAKGDPYNSFRISNPNIRGGESIISMRTVVYLKQGKAVYKRIPKEKLPPKKPTFIEITGSTGNKYKVEVSSNGHAISCTCPGYHFRRNCRHLKEVEEKIKNESARSNQKKGESIQRKNM